MLTTKLEEVPRALKGQLLAFPRDAFDDGQGPYDYGPQAPSLLALCIEDEILVGHLAAYVRDAFAAGRPLTVGLVGGVVVDEHHRGRGYARKMISNAHEYFRAQGIEFSFLFAINPDVYRSSGYREMTNKIRFLDTDGAWKEYIYRGGMVAVLTRQPWKDQYLDLCGPTV